MSIKLKGSSDGSVSFDAPADTSPSGSDITLTLPTSAGSADQFLKNSGIAGELEYSSMVETSTGVGIGTTAPDALCHINKTSGTTLYRASVGSNSTIGLEIVKTGSTTQSWRIVDGQTVNGKLEFYDVTDSATRMCIDGAGNVGINETSPLGKLHVRSADSGASSVGASADELVIENSGHAGMTILSGTDQQGIINFADPADVNVGGITYSHSDNTMAFRANDGEKFRISNGGYLKASNNNTYVNISASYHEFNQSNQAQTTIFSASHATYGATQVLFRVVRAATSAYWFVQGTSNAGSDTEFYIRGDGNAFADGSWSGGGADYAEYFEWSDGNTEAEDRRGISVVLDGDKIREAVAGEEPIGVISGNPSVVGDADVDRWKGKYLRDDYGSYVLDEDGYRQLNPDYDSSVEYVQREDRPEWDTVGLMGKLRIRKGQVTGARWIKMRDISDTVEEWLVR